MFETPNMKIVKMNEKHVKSIPSTNESFLNEAICNLADEIIEADKKLISDVANEINISIESATHYIKKYMTISIATEYDESGMPKIIYSVGMKSAIDILNYEPESEHDLEMDKKLEAEILNDYKPNILKKE